MVAGIDISSYFIDVVLIDQVEHDNPRVNWRRYKLQGMDAFERARDVRVAAPRWGEWWWDCAAIGIEDPRGFNPGPIFRVQGAIIASVPRNRLIKPWVPSEWRKKVGLPGNCTKREVSEYVREKLGMKFTETWTQDACDAWCIAEATRMSLTSAGECTLAKQGVH